MNRLRKIVAGAVVILVMAAIVLTPSFYLSLQETLLLGGRYERNIAPVTIDPEAEEIYMVRAVRDAYYLGVGLPKAQEQRLREEWSALKALIPGVPSLPAGPSYDGMDKTRGASDGMKLTLHEFLWESDGGQFAVTVHNEVKTGKFLSLTAQRYAPSIETGSAQRGHNSNAIARAFCAYLGLDILGDWSAQDSGLVSKKAALKIVCHDGPDSFSLSIAPLESPWNAGSPSQLIPAH